MVRISFYTKGGAIAEVIISLNSVRIRFFTRTGAELPPGDVIEDFDGITQTELIMTVGQMSIEILVAGAFKIDGVIYAGYMQMFSDEMSQQLNIDGESRIEIETAILPPRSILEDNT